jgi:hypothetical protein
MSVDEVLKMAHLLKLPDEDPDEATLAFKSCLKLASAADLEMWWHAAKDQRRLRPYLVAEFTARNPSAPHFK